MINELKTLHGVAKMFLFLSQSSEHRFKLSLIAHFPKKNSGQTLQTKLQCKVTIKEK